MHQMFPQLIRTTDFSPSRRELLQETALQAEVLDRVSCLLLEKNDSISARDSESKNLCLLHQIWTQNCEVAISGSGGVHEGKHTSCLYFKSSRRPRGRGMCCCSGRSVWPTAALRSVATRTVSPGRWRNVTHTRWRPSSPASQKKVQKHLIPPFLLKHQNMDVYLLHYHFFTL